MNATNPSDSSVPSTVTEADKKVSKNPHEVSLGKFLRGREQHISKGYARLSNGQIVKVKV